MAKRVLLGGLLLAVSLFIIMGSTSSAQPSGQARWEIVTLDPGSAVPPARASHAMAYDSRRKVVVLFGGSMGVSGLCHGDTWEFSVLTKTWTLKVDNSDGTEISPVGLRSSAMAYDEERGVVVLFGGQCGNEISNNYTWEWDGQQWDQKTPENPAESPSARAGHAMYYDSQERAVFLFGGCDYYAWRNDLWKWTVAQDGHMYWQRIQEDDPSSLTEKPERRSSHSVIYSPARNQAILFGGVNEYHYPSPFNDTWSLTAGLWEQLAYGLPEGRWAALMALDSARGKIVLFGGKSESAFFGNTWELDEITGAWTQSDAVGPSARATFGVYDTERRKVVLFGGLGASGLLSDTWEYGLPEIVADAGENCTFGSDEIPTALVTGSAMDPAGLPLSYRWLESDTELTPFAAVGANGTITLALGTLPFLQLGEHNLTLEVTDGWRVSRDDLALTIANSSPKVNSRGTGVYEINTEVILAGAVADCDGDLVTYEWHEGSQVLFSGGIVCPLGGEPVDLPVYQLSTLPIGIHILSLSVCDGVNPPMMADISVEIIDTNVPTLAPSADHLILWPPNQEMIDIRVLANAADNSGGAISLSVAISSDEPETGLGDDDLGPDWTIPIIDQANGIITFKLRAQRSGREDGRIYTIKVTAQDLAGNSSEASILIIVPHSMKKLG